MKTFTPRGGLISRARSPVRAVDGISFDIARGRTLGLVGESGCGKTTVGRAILFLDPPTAGTVRFAGVDLGVLSRDALRRMRQRFQPIFQDPFSSLNPRMRVSQVVGEGLQIHGLIGRRGRRERVAALLEEVGLPASHLERYPHQFSGGQRQRIGIARALAMDPEFIVADEVVSALDVSVQAQILNLIVHLQETRELAFLFISHDLSVIEHISHDVAVMYLGRIVERGTREEIFADPRHPYTRALLSATPSQHPDHRPERVILTGDCPDPSAPPPGCAFHPRCPLALPECRAGLPAPVSLSATHEVSCLRTREAIIETLPIPR